MSYIKQILEPGEEITCQAGTCWIAYLTALAIFACTFHPAPLLRLISTELALTNKRLIGKTGILGKSHIAIAHAKIESISVRQTGLGKFLDYGQVIIRGKDGSKTVFKGIRWPLILQMEVDEAIEIAVLGRRLMDFDKTDES